MLGWLVGFDDGGVVGLRLGEVGGLVEGVDVHLEIKGIAVRGIWWNVMRIEDRGIGWSSGLAAGPVVGGNDGRIVYEVFGGSGDVRGVWTVWALLVPFWYLRTSAPGICFGLGSNEAELGSRWSWRQGCARAYSEVKGSGPRFFRCLGGPASATVVWVGDRAVGLAGLFLSGSV